MLNITWRGIIRSLRFERETEVESKVEKKIEDKVVVSIIAAVIILIPVILGILKVRAMNRTDPTSTLILVLGDVVMFLLFCGILVPLHEFLHALVMPRTVRKNLYFYKGNLWVGEFSFILTFDDYMSKQRTIATLLFPNVMLGVIPYVLWMNGVFDVNALVSKLLGFLILVLMLGFYSDLKNMIQIIVSVPKHGELLGQLSGFYYITGNQHHSEVVVTNATLVSLEGYDYKNYAAGKGVAINKPFFEAGFKVDNGEVIVFEISPVEASVLEVNETGSLKYKKKKHANSLIGFADKINEVS